MTAAEGSEGGAMKRGRSRPNDAAILRAVRAHDREEAAQKGEPDPWEDDFPEPYRSERMAAMRLAFAAAAEPTAFPIHNQLMEWPDDE